MKKPVGTLATLGVVLALAVLLANAWISYRNTEQLVDREGWVEHTQLVRATIGEVQASISDAVAAQRGYLLIGDLHFLDPYTSGRAAIQERLQNLGTLTSDNSSQQQRVAVLRDAVGREFAVLDQTIALRKTSQMDFSRRPELLSQGKGAMDTIRATVAAMDAEEAHLLTERDVVAKGSYHKALATFAVATAAAIGLVVLSYLLIRRDEALRRAAAKEQNRLANYNQLLIESTGDGIYGVDLEGKCTFLNAAGARLLGLKLESIIGQHMHALSHHSHADGTPYPDVECPIYKAASGPVKACVLTGTFSGGPIAPLFPWNTPPIPSAMMAMWREWSSRSPTFRAASGPRPT